MRLFVSYARVDKPYCIQIVDTLDIHDTWYDQRLYAGQDWWKEILRRLDWCEGFVYLLSPESVKSEYCRREYELALSLGRHIFPVLVHADTEIPESLKKIQYADLSKGLTAQAVKTLLNAIYIAETQKSHPMPLPVVASDSVKPPKVDPATVVTMAVTALENGQYDQAVFLLKQAKEAGYTSQFINLDAILAEAEKALDKQSYLRAADREYRQIAALVKHAGTSKFGCEAFTAFRKVYSDYDPENLAAICGGNRVLSPTASLPLLSWCPIPGGEVKFQYADKNEKLLSMTFKVQPFQISKYPVTNAQFTAFVEDPQGYSSPDWWNFSPNAIAWRKAMPEPRPSTFKGDERPREMVCWYEAMAYCNWLSDRLGVPVSLPTIAEWQRAFQGDTTNEYPWGNTFNQKFCNTAESHLKMTTLVNAYDEGASPFGVYDMAGNVWEWCLNLSQDANFDTDATRSGPRIVRGGSFISPGHRSKVLFHYHLQPEAHYASTGFRIVTR